MSLVLALQIVMAVAETEIAMEMERVLLLLVVGLRAGIVEEDLILQTPMAMSIVLSATAILVVDVITTTQLLQTALRQSK